MLWIHTVLIQGSRDQLAFDQSPELIAVFHALHRLLAPRHPPHALSSLAELIHPLAVIRRLRVRLTDQEKIKLRYRPVRAFGQVGVTKSILRFSRRIQRISYLHKKLSSLVKIQLFPLPNCQRTAWQNPRGIHDNQQKQQSFDGLPRSGLTRSGRTF